MLPTSIGRGLFITASVVYFTKAVGLTPVQVGTGLTIAASIALFAGVPMGHLADRIGPRAMTVAFGLAAALALTAYFLVSNWSAFLAVASLVAIAQSASGAARGALIAGSVPPERRVRTRAYLRVVTNVGWMVGAPLAGVALYLDTDAAYMSVILATGAVTATGALLFLRVPPVARQPESRREPMGAVLRDRPYLALTVLNAVLSIHYGIANVAIPLWVLERTEAPVWIISVLLVINTVMIVTLQVRTSRGSGTVTGAARAQRYAGLLLAAACGLYALAAGLPVWIAASVLMLGAAVHAFGELFQASGGWGLSFELAPDHAQGQYQGLYNTGFQVSDIVAPAVLAVAVIGLGWPGWIVMGACFAAAGLAVPPLARWAERTRPPAPDAATVAAAAKP
ncbi:MFS transporter [Glycomyces buryatensis]|uniref:MFS transporter n=2 Tax=Glycomyces buryatensis TaxID=2570927 RepID=A0A4S8QGY1_9ACTN|nr:MFS transporter [Glycomyces buryatensis]